MNDHIKELKAFKPPFWSRWLGNFRAWKRTRFRNKQWKHITVITVWCTHTTQYRSTEEKIVFNTWFSLSERADGKRKYKFIAGRFPINYKHGAVYARVVVPWMEHGISNEQVRSWANQTHVKET